jgi:hypothetical protein
MQWRRREKRGPVRDPFYAPERDLAHIGTALCRAGVVALEERFVEPWFRPFAEANGITEDVLKEAVVLYAKTLNLVFENKNPEEAAAATGFDKLPAAVQLAVYGKLGQVTLSGIWAALRDVNQPESAPPKTLEELLDDVISTFDPAAEKE